MSKFESGLVEEALKWYSELNKTQIAIPYGDRTISIEVPVGFQQLDHPNVKTFSGKDAISLVAGALDSPTNSQTLTEMVESVSRPAKYQKATVIVCDRTRPVPYHYNDPRGILKPILERLYSTGITTNNTTILVALGTHPNIDGDKWAQDKFGKEITEKGYNIVFHDCNAYNLVSLGGIDTGHGSVEVKLNELLTESDIIVPTGFIEPHFMAGASGGAKLFLPGCSSIDAIINGVHGPSQMVDPRCDLLSISNNPIQKTIRETVNRLVKLYGPKIFNVNVTMLGEKLTGVFAGDIEESYKKGVELLKSYAQAYVNDPMDVVIFPAGPVSSNNQYQLVKALYTASRIMEKGSYALIISPTLEKRVGANGYVSSMKKLAEMGPEVYLQEVVKEDYDYKPEEWQTVMCARALKNRKNVIWVTDNLTKDQLNGLPGNNSYDLLLQGETKLKIKEIIQRSIAVACYKRFKESRNNPSVAYISRETVVPTLARK